MASYNVTLYENSGYNVINIPDNPARLRADSIVVSLPAINILQNRRLTEVTVACENSDAEKADYIQIGNMFYAIVDFKMQSVSTCLFSIVEKPLLSVGGITVASDGTVTTNFDILDGITSRCTVKEDAWGAYTSADPLTAPQEPLQIQTEWLNDSTDGDHIFIESLVELCQQGTPAFREGITYTDEETGETVTIPQTASLPIVTGEGIPQHTDFTIDGVTDTRGSQIYWRDDPATADDSTLSAAATIQGGLDTIRSLGQEQGSIIGQYKVPDKFIGSITNNHAGIQGEISESGTATVIGTEQVITNISGVSGSVSSSISPAYATVKNKRVLYGEYNKYGMITCAGNSAEFKPEDLGSETAPSISYKSDPKPDGKPYYRFTTINSDSEFWRNCLAGCTWANVPLVYQGASGSALTRLNFDNERKIASLSKEQYNENYILSQIQAGASIADSAIGMVTGAGMMQSTAGSGSYSGMVSPGLGGVYSQGQSQMYSGGGGILSGIAGMASNAIKKNQYTEMYNAQKANELSGLYQATDIYAPTVNFPYNATILQVIKGNGVLIYKYRMSDSDVARVDKLLTMYGYRTAEQLTPANFGRRQKFDYIACSSVSVTGSYPKWLCDDIADELKNGVRIWHVKPDSSAYDNNPVRS